ncbi:hypothetical protein M378DRAFT_816028 [Amanita muscaria Koide BX008]|uniref:Uncharacterized protein n=1 Tax=Amanita muscaria (strain Koide BX008) TaxID=946122 RepID=A0A0C2SFE2_AMAMK|nr:hypothetical protein M378DRAFT_816028 [Amanita muscaria Koide BX008]
MVRSSKWTVFTLWAALPAVVRGGLDALEKRNGNVTTSAVCQSTYSWMNNENSQPPCFVAATLSAACATAGDWNVPAVNSTYHYSLPDSSTANYCVCSWAVYNLLGACTVCQNSTSVDNWSPYQAGCGNFTTSTAFPTKLISVYNNTLLPYWAATDPSKWSGFGFNSDEAFSIHSQGIALFLPLVEYDAICISLSRKK